MYREKNASLRVLLSCSPVLGAQAREILDHRFGLLDVISWDCANVEQEDASREFLEKRRFDIAISFYSCFIFRPAELERIAIPLNIHPASPSLPGWCHELLPVAKGHRHLGVTVHFMTDEVDHGDIVEVSEYDLPIDRSPENLRAQVFERNLEALKRLCDNLSVYDDVASAAGYLESCRRRTNRRWEGPMNSRRSVALLLANMEQSTA